MSGKFSGKFSGKIPPACAEFAPRPLWQQNTVHTHTTLCDGQHTPAKMAAAALRQGFCTLGFSGHSPVPGQDWCMPAARLPIYRAEIAQLRQKYDGRLNILCGIEWDARSFDFLRPARPGAAPLLAPEYGPDGWDYWIGSVHLLPAPGEADAGLYSVDWGPDLAALLGRYQGDGLALAAAYYREMARMAAQKPTILGHFDLVRKLNAENRYFDEESPAYRSAALEALAAADPAVSLLEINTGGMARGYRAEPYPAQFLLRAWKARGGRVTITADAHTANALRYAYTAAAAWASAAGYREVWLLQPGGAVPAAL